MPLSIGMRSEGAGVQFQHGSRCSSGISLDTEGRIREPGIKCFEIVGKASCMIRTINRESVADTTDKFRTYRTGAKTCAVEFFHFMTALVYVFPANPRRDAVNKFFVREENESSVGPVWGKGFCPLDSAKFYLLFSFLTRNEQPFRKDFCVNLNVNCRRIPHILYGVYNGNSSALLTAEDEIASDSCMDGKPRPLSSKQGFPGDFGGFLGCFGGFPGGFSSFFRNIFCPRQRSKLNSIDEKQQEIGNDKAQSEEYDWFSGSPPPEGFPLFCLLFRLWGLCGPLLSAWFMVWLR